MVQPPPSGIRQPVCRGLSQGVRGSGGWSSCAVIEASTEPELAATWRIMVFMSLRCSLPRASPYNLLSLPCSSPSSRNSELSLSMGAPSNPRSNSSSPDDIAHSSERREGASSPSELGRERRSSGSTPSARASFRNVPKWGREILPLSIPETVVGLPPPSSASRAWVHIRLSRISTKFLLAALLSTLDLLTPYSNI